MKTFTPANINIVNRRFDIHASAQTQSVSAAWISRGFFYISCVLPVSLSEAVNKKARLAWRTQRSPPINLREENAEAVTHRTRSHSFHQRCSLKVKADHLNLTLSIIINLMIVIEVINGDISGYATLISFPRSDISEIFVIASG